MAENEKEKEYADIVVSEVDRLEHILRDVLTFSREAKVHFVRESVTDSIKGTIASFSELCKEQSIKVEANFNTDLPVLIDRDQIRQATNTLVANAIDAMPAGGTLTVTTDNEEFNGITYVVVRVADTGPGIPEETLPLIFEPF